MYKLLSCDCSAASVFKALNGNYLTVDFQRVLPIANVMGGNTPIKH